VKALTPEEIDRGLADLPGWQRVGGEIVKEFRFPSFMAAIGFIGRIAEKAEAADHHPDLQNHYSRVRVALHTWSEKAITEKDLALGREIESVSGLEHDRDSGQP